MTETETGQDGDVESTLYCPQCRREVDQNVAYCPDCGAPVSHEARQETTESTETASWARASLLLGIFAFFTGGITGPFALWTGVKSDREGEKSGRATAGLVLGALGTGLLVWAIIFIGALGRGVDVNGILTGNKTPSSQTQGATPAEESLSTKPQEKEPSFELTAQELQKAYSDNAVAAKDKYEDKRVLVTGRVDNISLQMNQPHVRLGPEQPLLIARVTCKFPEEASDNIAKLAEDDKITVNGIVAGEPMGMGVYIEDSKLVE